jgi:hypothetical protein
MESVGSGVASVCVGLWNDAPEDRRPSLFFEDDNEGGESISL